ncbi:hypothetical protein EDB89DRAFT_987003 [Lactarius sanguifluus]|nr:hypothetical protein EDB89DRAFT_987003 [Lactarius sanguifluus]
MSDDDRATKAARAKALLNKKRQQKKSGPISTPSAGAGAVTSTTPTPGSPLVRALSPTLVDPSDEIKADVTDLLGTGPPTQDVSENEWLTSLPRVGTPSIVSPPAPVNAASPGAPSSLPSPSHANGEELESLRAELQNQRQTIALLVSEKMSLSTSLGRLSDVSSRASELEALLREERAAAKSFREQTLQQDDQSQQHYATIERLSRKEKELEDKCREQERELQLTKSSAEGLKFEFERSQGLVRELQERIQSDDVRQLEASLKNVQNRASELEFQLSKSKQAHVSLKADHDRIENELKERTASSESLAAKVSDLEGRHVFAQKQLTSVTAEHQALRLERTSLQSQLDEHLGSIAGLRKAASQSATNQEALNRQLRSSQADLRNAIRRAEEAERTHQDLQNEGSSLMRSLDEMRPKIVELTNAKLELSETNNLLEQAVRDRDSVIAQLESSLQAAQDQNESLASKLLDTETARERDRSSTQETQDELQRGYAQIETELSDALASIRELEVERAGQRQLANQRVDELDRMSSNSHSLKVEIASLHQELEERKLAEVEQEEFLERARTDVEVLRADLAAKVQEIEELRAEVSAAAASPSSSSSPSSPSLDKEMMNALKQQHRLELSAAQSQIRAFQSSVFEAEARAHSFQKQLSQSEDQLAQLRAASQHVAAQRPFSPTPSRPSSRQRGRSDDLRRASLSSSSQQQQQRRGGPPQRSPAPSAFGVNLSPETRHKRKVSLGMLKARIDSEMAAVVIPSVPASRATSPLYHHASAAADPDNASPMDPHATHDTHSLHKRSQFLDESHIFWCHSCRGELVVL